MAPRTLALALFLHLAIAWASSGVAGPVLSYQKVSSTAGSFGGVLADHNAFGRALATLGDLDGDGKLDLAAGAPGDDDGGLNRGAVWNLAVDAGCFPLPAPDEVFADGFETGDAAAWDLTLGGV